MQGHEFARQFVHIVCGVAVWIGSAPRTMTTEAVIWLIIGLVALAAWWVADYFLYRRHPVVVVAPSVDVARDVWLLDALVYLAVGSWIEPKKPFEQDWLRNMGLAAKLIRQKAVDEKITIWGRKSKLGVSIPLPKLYWQHYGINIESVMLGSRKHVKTEPREPGGGRLGVCHFLKTNKGQVEAIRREMQG